jgi:hypothetical protein
VADQPALTIAYATESQLCDKFLTLYRSFKRCSLRKGNCFSADWDDEAGTGIVRIPTEQLAVNQYGYTSISIAEPAARDYSILHVQRFEGDRHPRLVETWKVDRQQFKELVQRKPHPLRHEDWVKGGHGIQRDTLAPEFAALLSRAERINQDGEPVWAPIFEAQGETYAITRECAGTWRYGGDYDCAQITKLTVKRMSATEKSAAVCQYVRPRAR